MKVMKWIGGGKEGRLISTFPLATLKVYQKEVHLNFLLSGKYRFRPDELYCIKQEGDLVTFLHNIAEYPENIQFAPTFVAAPKVIKEIEKLGFVPILNENNHKKRSGNLLSKKIFILILILICSFMIDLLCHTKLSELSSIYRDYGGFLNLAVIICFTLSLFIFKYRKLQLLIISEDRYITELKPVILLIRVILLIPVIQFLFRIF